jgi:hypothetical protein
MEPSTIYLLFSGLLAFVPRADHWTAYLVEGRHSGCDHIPSLVVTGSASLEQSGGICEQDEQDLIRCTLADTDITLPRLIGRRILNDTHPTGPLPKDETEGASAKWLIRVSRVEPDAAEAKDFSDGLEEFVGARVVNFNWDSVRTCHLEERGTGRVSVFRFSGGGFSTNHVQALAESVLFTATVETTNPVLINLRHRRTGVEARIRLNCASRICPIVSIENSANRRTCDPRRLHFQVYYHLSRMAPHRPMPGVVNGTVSESDVSDRCRPILEDALRESMQAQSKNFIQSLVNRRLIKNLVKKLRPEDRIICPPALFDR